MISECPRRLSAGARACFRPTRHPVQTPARRGHGGVASRRVDAVVSQPRSTPPSSQLDVAGTLGEGLPRRLRDTATDPARADRTCGAPSDRSASFLDRGARLGVPPRPHVGEQPPRPRVGEQPPPLEREHAATGRDPANAWLAAAGFGVVTHHVEHLLGHVLGVIADPFQALECKHGVERRLEELVVLHHE